MRRLLRSWRARFAAVLVLVIVFGLAVVVIGDDDDLTVETAGEEATTTSTSEPTSTSSSSTTSPPTTTSASTTTVAPVGTTPPPTTPPPPSTAPAPPPPTAPPAPATLDRPAVIAFARARPPGGPVPYMYSGSTGEVGSTWVPDGGDDADGDLSGAELVRDGAGTFRLFPGAPPYSAVWVEIDSGSGGCEGTDLMAIQWYAGEAPRGAVVRIPSCDPSSWSVVGATGNPGYPNALVDFLGSTFGDPTSFGWRAGMLGSPADTAADLAPSSGFAAFVR